MSFLKDETKILIVDDEKEIVDMLKAHLEANKYQIITAYSGREALEKVKLKPSLIILDIAMPEMDGLEVLRKIRQEETYKYIPVIMLSGKGESDFIFQAKDCGSTDYIIKPCSLTSLVSLIKRYII